jgi:cytochrome c oxidase subunit 3
MSVNAPAAEHHIELAHHFADLEQQKATLILGMWAFLITELMIFGGLFTAYTVYRYIYPVAFEEASGRLSWVIGGINTVVLITSSFTMVMGVYGAQVGNRRLLVGNLVATLCLGLAFLCLKGGEYVLDYHEYLTPFDSRFDPEEWHGWKKYEKEDPQHSGQVSELTALASQEAKTRAQIQEQLREETKSRYFGQVKLFLTMYYIMTGLHALHMIAGLSVLSVVIRRAAHGRYTPEYHPGVEMMGLYWHFVDLVWIFLLPLLYLSGAHPPG